MLNQTLYFHIPNPQSSSAVLPNHTILRLPASSYLPFSSLPPTYLPDPHSYFLVRIFSLSSALFDLFDWSLRSNAIWFHQGLSSLSHAWVRRWVSFSGLNVEQWSSITPSDWLFCIYAALLFLWWNRRQVSCIWAIFTIRFKLLDTIRIIFFRASVLLCFSRFLKPVKKAIHAKFCHPGLLDWAWSSELGKFIYSPKTRTQAWLVLFDRHACLVTCHCCNRSCKSTYVRIAGRATFGSILLDEVHYQGYTSFCSWMGFLLPCLVSIKVRLLSSAINTPSSKFQQSIPEAFAPTVAENPSEWVCRTRGTISWIAKFFESPPKQEFRTVVEKWAKRKDMAWPKIKPFWMPPSTPNSCRTPRELLHIYHSYTSIYKKA